VIELPREDTELQKQLEYYKKKHPEGEQNKRKNGLNDKFNFSYKLLKIHF
jgi:hypothetical protein